MQMSGDTRTKSGTSKEHRIMKTFTLVLAGVFLSCAVGPVDAARLKPNRIDIEYVTPKSRDHQKLFEIAKERRLLEKLRVILAPLRLPRRLLFKLEGCDGESNAWYDNNVVTVCYEFLDEISRNAPLETTPAGVTPIDAVVGPVVDVFLHETGHAIFELLRIPVFGREEDAADFFSAFLMLQLGKEDARRLIGGTAYQYKNELKDVWTQQKFANEHSTPAQRFYNVLCLAYGADHGTFNFVIDSGFLPKERAEFCTTEYTQIAYAFDRLVRPFIDKKLARKAHHTWLPPVTTPPPYRPPPVGVRP
jgi:hypothetical protein